MSETNHTPGPWEALCSNNDSPYDLDSTVWVEGECGGMVADCFLLGTEIPREQWWPNARLIAAAPDMLAALQAQAEAEAAEEKERSNDAFRKAKTLRAAALAKALGRETEEE